MAPFIYLVASPITDLWLPATSPKLTQPSRSSHCLNLGLILCLKQVALSKPVLDFVFKTDDKTKLTNYRPISLLSCFSKILEKIVYHRMIKFTDKNAVFSPYQFGFRPGCSTVHAIIDIIANCIDNINQQLFSGILFLDLSKAFDIVDHEILRAGDSVL